MSDPATLLAVRDLRTEFRTDDGLVRAVDGVSFALPTGRTFALVGESGCGKSVTAHSILRLIPNPPGRIVAGRIELEGQDILALPERRMRRLRGGRIAMIFQEPQSCLNPVFTCGRQIGESLRLHRKLTGRAARQAAIDLLARVGIPDPARRYGEYPHQLSGGMKQRVMIAMALAGRPQLLIADEPTTALDVTIQAQILELLRAIQAQDNLTVLLITHDLAVVAETAHQVAVMYAGKIVELAATPSVLSSPLHPYTQGLLRSVPRLGHGADRLYAIPGNVPNPLSFPPGCRFHPRCRLGRDDATCRTVGPPLREVAGGHWCACWKCPGFEAGLETDPAGGIRGKETGIRGFLD
ncbi:MAG: ABC transporter ATP-binding protein [Planctomycetota bacterium]|nr:ABC transporter ATP-binding protein [Planctomycetota bacterium]